MPEQPTGHLPAIELGYARPTIMRLESGHLAGKYRLLATLGRGGMADVYLACSQTPGAHDRLLVIKELRPALAQDPDFLDMFLDEARLAARLSHPNIVQTYEAFTRDDRYFIAMEHLDGQPLNRVVSELAKRGGLPWPAGLRVVSEALAGLHYAHELADYAGTPLGIVHRDATPHNVLVTYDGQVKLVDFGIAKALDSSTETRVGMLKGKVAYMAPEQARGEPVDRRTDVYAMGVVLWELLARRRMWRGLRDLTILNHLAAGEIPDVVGASEQSLPLPLAEICRRATAAEPARRFQTAAEFRDAIDAFLADLPEPPSPREVGALVAEAFAVEREQTSGLLQFQLLDSSRTPALLDLVYSSRSGSLDPRLERASLVPLTPAPTPAEFVVDIGAPIGSDLDTSVFPQARSSRGWRRRIATAGIACSLLAALVLGTVWRGSSPVPVELSGAIRRDLTLVSGRDYVLKSDVEIAAGATLTIQRGARLIADPQAGGSLLVAPGARLVSEP